ncbi:MAG: RagB/SusD family nutrient uptake outer membrane protein [Saprospiraceae bacterium]|nr:RagB/SusD family nutrient uptake outer membrane protein [Saprospiraceae bacterium]
MKNILFYLLFFTSLLLMSCRDELLDLAPVTDFSDLTVFDNMDRVELQARGLYNSVRSGNFLGGRYYVYHEIRGENFINELQNNVTGFSVWNFTVQPSNVNDVTNLWVDAYLAINRCNVFIDGLKANETKLKGLGATDATLNAYAAEARFLRALSFFYLSQLYGNPYSAGTDKLSIILHTSGNVGAGTNDIARSTNQQAYAQILDDLNFAEANLPLTRADLNGVIRAHRNTAIALKTRVYLHMADYSNVIAEANKIVSTASPFKSESGNAYSIPATVAASFASPYRSSDNIFSMPFTPNTLPGTQNGLGHYFNTGTGNGEYSLNPAGIISNTKWEDADTRRAMIVTASSGKKYWHKFPTGPQHLDYAPVLRYAEVLLNLAEALARTQGVDDRAIQLVNELRRRAGATEYTSANFANGADLIDAILFERQIELLGEGFRGMDLQRLQMTLPAKGNIREVEPISPAYLWPIPQSEILANKICAQNPGY